MVPMYAARVEHLTHHETVTALCEVCGHVAEVSDADLLRKILSSNECHPASCWTRARPWGMIASHNKYGAT
jgi:hypothetical protein